MAGGAGSGTAARPAGVYAISGDVVRWVPAVDVNRLMLGVQVLAIVALRSVLKARAKG